MKNYVLTITAAILVSFFLISDGYSQFNDRSNNNFGRGRADLNLTGAQEDQIEDLRLKHKEDMIKLRSELDLKQLDLKKLTTTGNFSRSDYLAGVKEISDVKSKIGAARANHRMDVYEMLDDTQKKEFLNRGSRDGRDNDGFGRQFNRGYFGRRNCR